MEPVKIMLGGTEYTVPPLNMKQQRRIDAATVRRADDPAATVELVYDTVSIAMERADPRPVSPEAIEAPREEIYAAYRSIVDANRVSEPGEAIPPGNPSGDKPDIVGAGAISTAS